MPKKSALASSKKVKVPGRHITFAPSPTFLSVSTDGPPLPRSAVSACSTKVCLCAPTNHPGSFRCRLHRNDSFPKHSSSASVSQSGRVSRQSLDDDNLETYC
ncbi:hypothetical protein KP509_32G044400 [Ceratopteris richardii]|nr:hypothetical protein KP509_32G044400 [Ceratopteris richardii]